MTWPEAQKAHPHTWLLLEVTAGRTEGRLQIADQVEILRPYSEGDEALRRCNQLQTEFPDRRFLVGHTDNESIEVEVTYRFGIRPAS